MTGPMLPGLAAVPDAADETTLECDICEAQITGKASGPGSAAWKLGTHKRVKHGVQGRGRKRRGAPTEADHDAHPVLASVREVASDIGIGKKGAPTADELAAGLGKGLTILTMGGATIAVETDPTIPHGQDGQAERDLVIDALTLDRTAATGVMTPIGRMMAGTRINKRYGRAVVDNVDVLGSLFDLGLLVKAWRDYLALRAGRTATLMANAGPQLDVAPPPGPVPDQSAPPPGVVVGGDYATRTPPMQQGKVLTADDVEAMRNRRAG